MKKDFPIFAKDLVYLDSSATTQKPRVVIDAIAYFYASQNASIRRGLYHLSEKATELYEAAREQAAQYINGDKDNLVFTRSATESLNLIALGLDFKASDNVVATAMEHHSNFLPWQKRTKLKVAGIKNDGSLDVDHLLSLIDKNTKVVALTQASNVTGAINDVAAICKKIKEVMPDCLVVVDCAQSAPYGLVDVAKMGCDFVVLSAHKMFGPYGVGVLYGKIDLLAPALVGGGMVKDVLKDSFESLDGNLKFEAGTMDVAGVVGFGVAIDYLKKFDVLAHSRKLTDYALKELKKIKGISIYGPAKRIGVISFNISGIHPHDLAQELARDNISVRAGHHCAILLHRALGINSSLRISFSVYNDKSDVDRMIVSLKKAIKLFYGK